MVVIYLDFEIDILNKISQVNASQSRHFAEFVKASLNKQLSVGIKAFLLIIWTRILKSKPRVLRGLLMVILHLVFFKLLKEPYILDLGQVFSSSVKFC